MTKGALYFHFESKEDIAHALVEEQHRTTREAATRILESDASAVELMMRLCMDLAMRLIDDPVVRAGDSVDDGFVDILHPRCKSRIAIGSTRLNSSPSEPAMTGETNGRVAPDVLARVIIPSFTGVQLVSEAFTRRQDLPERIHELWQVLLGAIMPTDTLDAMLAVAEDVFTVPAPRRRRKS